MRLSLALLIAALLPLAAQAKVGPCELMVLGPIEVEKLMPTLKCNDLEVFLQLPDNEYSHYLGIKRIGELKCLELLPQVRDVVKNPAIYIGNRANAVAALGAVALPEDKDFLLEMRKLVAKSWLDSDNELIEQLDRVLYNDFHVSTSHRLFRHVGARFSTMTDRRILRFPKTGSATYLIGGNTEAILRVFRRGPYEQWKKAFEAKDLWAAHGFDYVPVEPIISAGSDIRQLFPALHPIQLLVRDNSWSVAVLTKVLNGHPLGEYSALEQEKFNDQVERIIKVLTVLKIVHGHLHEGNFVIVDGRLYVIDFDRAFGH